MRLMNHLIVVAIFLALAPGQSGVVAQGPPPCEQDVRYRDLDFWLGEWRVVDAEGRTIGTNSIRKAQQGCLIEESWESSGGGTGQSMNYFDPSIEAWRQHRVDQGGGIVHYEGRFENGVLHYQGRSVQRDGTITMARVSLGPIDGGRLRHLIEHSEDGGSTWSTYFEGTYIPLAGQVVAAGPAEPAAAEGVIEAPPEPEPEPEPESEPEPVEEPVEEPSTGAAPVAETPSTAAAVEPAPEAASSGVKAVTRELELEEIPQDQIQEVVMASPMVLEVVPGNIYDYPENAAWRSDETRRFICNQVTIEQVGIGHRARGDGVELLVTAVLRTERRQKKVDLLVELVENGEVVATEEFRMVRVGLNIPAHGHRGLPVEGKMRLSSEQFQQLFGDDSRPTLRLTLSVP